MKILHVFKTYLPDSFTGVERVIWEIAEGTRLFGIESDVFTLSARPGRTPVQVGHHRVHQVHQQLYVASTGISLSAFGTFPALAAAADIVHYHFPWPIMDLLHFAARHGKPTVVTYHSDIVRQAPVERLYRPLMKKFLASVDRIVATSPNYLASSTVLQRFPDKTTAIPIGISPRHTPDSRRVAHWRRRLGPRFFLFVGALRYYKGLTFLIEAARLTGLPVVILGAGEMQGEIACADLPNVTLLGRLGDADREALLELCAAFVFPSHLRSEAFGVALVEAARAGRPMISCELGTGTSFVNRNGETGIVVAPSDPTELARAMRLLWHDEGLARRMGQAAADRFARHFTSDAMCRAYQRLYEELIASRARLAKSSAA